MKYRVLTVMLFLVAASLQYRFWFGEGGLAEVRRLSVRVEQQQQINQRLQDRNAALIAEVNDLKQGLDTVEGLARLEMGMIRSGETFFQIIQ